ncbi:bifunctional riboflavin kinase/FAD synthetase [[Pseudomonas] carboxydohydrogena]|uniref:Riboflavin biosynthesis protein n=1 Tax=Afipia carboxydohydrogena TaxID=290 RepID=A0ABY8BQK1_AFICR|nr:bifunctional riboflavin kinase/FAD synthetase [[Pseudomonas] carboxydohydrogena]WEF51194.1 bifunctional riboflavin kinase/FAD synthetase [[Pseudomonas] carboxydohydrogena]
MIKNPFQIIRDTTPPAGIPRGAVIALGNFDGVHLGHRTVIAAAQKIAKSAGQKAFALSFEPHPRSFFNPAAAHFRLTNEQAKLRLLAGTGLDGAVVLDFNAARAATSAQDFINQELVERLGVSGISVGDDFHFGKGRSGSPATLAEQGERLGFKVHIQSHVDLSGLPISSSAIRAALKEGRIRDATAMLGGPWFVSGTVIHGEKRGRELGYPTANIRLDPHVDLRHGIYAVRVGLGGGADPQRLGGVASYGRRPTFDNGPPLLEVFLFDFNADLYGQTLDVAFIEYLRDEMKFDNITALIRQMDDDSLRARAVLEAAPRAFPTLGEVDE